MPPATFQFFYRLGESDGSDQTRTGPLVVNVNGVDNNVIGDILRKGEPYGELGLIIQQDRLAPFDWASQNGAPIDNQAGNTPGGMRDTRGDGLNGGTTNTLAVSEPTEVEELVIFEVVEQSFSYWVASFNNEDPNSPPPETLDWVFSMDPFTSGLSLIRALQLNTLFAGDEFEWSVVPITP